MISLLIALCWPVQDDAFPRRVEIDALDHWPRSGRIIVDGVFSLLGDAAGTNFRPMQLRKSPVRFNVPRSLLLEKTPTGNIDVTGVVEVVGGKTVVQVEDIKLLPSDESRFQTMMDEAGEVPAKLFSASAWAKRRHVLYKAPSMLDASERAFRTGLELERRLAGGQPDRLAALKDKLIRNQALASFDFGSIDHEIIRAEFDKLSKDDPKQVLDFAERIYSSLPGAKEIGDAVDPRHRAAYDSKPIQTYDEADGALRHALARYYYSTVIDKALLLMHQKGGAAPFDLAELGKQKVPEYREVARKWYREWAKAQEGRIEELEPDAASETARTIESELESFARAASFRNNWLEARETKIRRREREAKEENAGKSRTARDADAWFELAKTRLNWFPGDANHESRAVKILDDVLSIAPQFSKAEIELRRLGYVQQSDGAWRPKFERNNDPKRSPTSRTLAENMTTADVLAAYGKPTHQARAVTAAGTQVVWIYQFNNKETLVVFSGPPESLRVSRIRRPQD